MRQFITRRDKKGVRDHQMDMKWVKLNFAVYCKALYKKSEYTYQDMVYINACYVLKHAETLNEIFR